MRHVRKDNVEAEKHYKLAIESNPSSSDALGSYASFLHGVLSDFEEATKYYEKSVAVDNCNTNNLCNFGLFLR